MTIYSLDVLLSQFWTSLLFHVWFCCFLTCTQVSQEAGQVVWCSYLFKNFPQFVVIHTIKGLYKLDLEKAEEPEIRLPTSVGSSKKQESSRKTSTSALLTMPKPLTVWITTNCGKFWKRWEYQTTRPASGETCMQVKKQQLELDME